MYAGKQGNWAAVVRRSGKFGVRYRCVVERILLDNKYVGYIEKEQRIAAKAAKMDAIKLDPAMNYAAISSLSAEAREKLKIVKPLTVDQAARIPDIRQGDVALLMVLAGKK